MIYEVKGSIAGRRTLWWNQRARLQKQSALLPKHVKLEGVRYSGIFKGGSRQAVCPFCYKAFYDKSTMNRHVSKRVCIPLQYQVPGVDDDDETSATIDGTTTPEECHSTESNKSTAREPCPYCKKMLKGQRGVRKHLDFYGCPMAIALRVDENE